MSTNSVGPTAGFTLALLPSEIFDHVRREYLPKEIRSRLFHILIFFLLRMEPRLYYECTPTVSQKSVNPATFDFDRSGDVSKKKNYCTYLPTSMKLDFSVFQDYINN